MGKKRDMLNRSKHPRADGTEVQRLIGIAQDAVFNGMSFKNQFFNNTIGESSLTTVRVSPIGTICFSQLYWWL